MRLFLRALRRIERGREWEAAIWMERPTERPPVIPRALRDRVRICGPKDCDPAELIAAADVLCVASGGPRAAPGLVREALAAGTITVASRIPVYSELLADGDAGLLFPPGDPVTLAGQLSRLGSEPALRRRLRTPRQARGPALVGRRRRARRDLRADRRPPPRPRRQPGRAPADRAARAWSRWTCTCTPTTRPTARPRSTCCSRPPATRGWGRSRSPTTTRSPARSRRASWPSATAVPKVIVAEEVKTAEQGEVIGLFVEEKIPRGLTMAETIAEIRRQGGLVYVPHPFDRLHSVPDYEHLLDIVEDIDILEVFNPRVALTAFNEEAERFAAKYRIVPGAGSDSPRRAGARQRPDPHARLRGAGGVPRVDARRRHHAQAPQPDLRAGAEAGADGRWSGRKAAQAGEAGKK